MGKALELLAKLEIKEFDWKKTNQHEIGLIAEEVEKVIPEAVYYNDKNEVEGLKFLPLIAVVIEAIHELDDKIGVLKNKELNDRGKSCQEA